MQEHAFEAVARQAFSIVKDGNKGARMVEAASCRSLIKVPNALKVDFLGGMGC